VISPARYDRTNDPIKSNGLKNVVDCRWIILDNDGGGEWGGLRPDEFADLFPELRMRAYNTYSSSNDQLRYRIYVPTDGYMTAAIYQHITGEMMQRLGERGYRSNKYLSKHPERSSVYRCHGFDVSKLTCAIRYFVPSQSHMGADHSFKLGLNLGADPLRVRDWISTSSQDDDNDLTEVARMTRHAALHPANQMKTESRIHQIRARWYASNAKGNHNSEFMKLARSLFMSGIDVPALKVELREAAEHCRSPAERRRQIPGIIKTIRATPTS
jgi:hypothetical protein